MPAWKMGINRSNLALVKRCSPGPGPALCQCSSYARLITPHYGYFSNALQVVRSVT